MGQRELGGKACSAERQLSWQATETERARLHAAEREEWTVFFAERKHAYAALGKAAFDLLALSAEVAYYAEADNPERYNKAFAELRATVGATREALTAVEIVGSEQQAALARRMGIEYTSASTGNPDMSGLEPSGSPRFRRS